MNTFIKMEKEEQIRKSYHLQQTLRSLPLDIAFTPEAVQVPFAQKLKLQIAFYRSNKVCKTVPAKYMKDMVQSDPKCQDHSFIRVKPQNLIFCTTINFDTEYQIFEIKNINVQLAYDADGRKTTLDSQINLSSLLQLEECYEKNNIEIQFNENCRLLYGVKIKILGLNELGRNLRGGKKTNKSIEPLRQKSLNILTTSDDHRKSSKKQKSIKFDLAEKQNVKISPTKMREKSLRGSWRIKEDEDVQNTEESGAKNSNSSIRFRLTENIRNETRKSPQKQLYRCPEELLQTIKNLQQQCQIKQLKINQLEVTLNFLAQQLRYAKEKQKNSVGMQQKDEKKYQIIESLSKQLGKIRKINQECSKKLAMYLEGQNLKNNEIRALKKEIQSKQAIIKKLSLQIKDFRQQAQTNRRKDSSSLEVKLQNQKLRRQCEHTKKNQRSAITQKMQIDCQNKSLHEEIIRLKQAIGKMLNSVQQQGSPQLFLKIADYVS